eukprot:gnl/Trimastix_PCT/179.p1 GENE.gnl/Trimastix_PCT/179~~gnl/Trimastix_PCT/179.p1  ORF type:complete len:633 (+),score=177.66 gnl/Trimastix_PCT/179:40-1899(+)
MEEALQDPRVNLDCTIVVDGLPIIPEDKKDKFLVLIRKIYAKMPIVDIHIPFAEGKSKGFAFITFDTPRYAQDAKKKSDGYALDKRHRFSVYSIKEFDEYEDISDEYELPPYPEYTSTAEIDNWLTDSRSRDQFLIRYLSKAEISWFDQVQRVEVQHTQSHVDSHLVWSPWGTYLAVFYKSGILLRGGDNQEEVVRFPHSSVRYLQFSPNEQYLLTYSESLFQRNSLTRLWRVAGAKSIGTLPVSPRETQIKWSAHGRYLAYAIDRTLVVVALPDLREVLRQHMPRMEAFEWSPADETIAMYLREDKALPACMRVIVVPSGVVVADKNLFDAKTCSLHWHPKGHFLAGKVELEPQGKKGGGQRGSCLQLFSLRERDIPIVEVLMEDAIYALEWEPEGNHFAILHGSQIRPQCSVYSMTRNAKGQITRTFSIEKVSANTLRWSPAGNFFVLAAIGSMQSGTLEFVSVRDRGIIGSAQHMLSSDIAWDPSGRVLASWVNNQRETDQGYRIFNSRGDTLVSQLKEYFTMFAWRPRPPSVLTAQEVKAVKKNLNTYMRRYEEEDNIFRQGVEYGAIQQRVQQRADYDAWRQRKAAEAEELKTLLADLDETLVDFVEESYTELP